MTISELREFDGKTVVMKFLDGEVTSARVLFIDLEYEDILVDIIESTRHERYRSDAAYAVAAADLLSAEELSNPV